MIQKIMPWKHMLNWLKILMTSLKKLIPNLRWNLTDTLNFVYNQVVPGGIQTNRNWKITKNNLSIQDLSPNICMQNLSHLSKILSKMSAFEFS